MTAYLARLFYLGHNYHGSQWQPGLRTIQGTLIDAVMKWSGEEHSTTTVQLSGRTDGGVHSIGQIVMITTEKPLDINQINKHLPSDIALWAYTVAPPEFRPRHSILMRHYRYYLDTSNLELNIESMRAAAQYLTGAHDFALLSKSDGNRSSKATLLNTCIMESKGTLIVDIYGTSFLWKLVRKIVSLLLHVGTGELSPELVPEIFKKLQAIRSGIRPAPPECLVLVEAVIPFRMNHSKFAMRRVRKEINTQLLFFAKSFRTMSALNDDFLSNLGVPC